MEFFRQYHKAGAKLHGIDTTITVPTPVEARLARVCLKLDDDVRVVRIAVPCPGGSRQFVTCTPTAGCYTPPGQATRGFVAYDIIRKRKVFLKDSWQVDMPDIEKEGATYQLLHEKKVRNIAPCSAAGDIEDHATLTHTFQDELWACKPTKLLIPHHHYCLVLDIIGQCLTDFSSSLEMLRCVRDALICKCDEHPHEYYSFLAR